MEAYTPRAEEEPIDFKLMKSIRRVHIYHSGTRINKGKTLKGNFPVWGNSDRRGGGGRLNGQDDGGAGGRNEKIQQTTGDLRKEQIRTLFNFFYTFHPLSFHDDIMN